MAYIVTSGTYPAHKAMEVGKAFLKAPKLPDYVKTEHVFNTAAGKYKFFSIYQITDDSKYFDAMKAIVTRYAAYRDIEGYEYTIYPVLEAKDALSIVGLA